MPKLGLRIFLLILGCTSFLAAVAGGFFTNPQVPQGGSATFAYTGTEGPTTGTWDILNSANTQIANSTAPNGWTVVFSNPNFTVTAPSTATVATNYKVRQSDLASPGDSSAGAGFSEPAEPEAQTTGQLMPPGGGGPTPSSHSALFDVVSGGGSAPAAPTGLSAVGGTSKATLTWSSSAGATGYNVKRATTSGGPYTTIATSVSSPYVNTGLTNGVTYYFVVTATNSNGESGNSNQASATPIAIPTGVAATAGNSSVALSWSAAAGATGYKIKYGTVSGTYPNSVTTSTTSGTVTGLTNGTTYYFVVSGTNTVGESDNSTQVSATPSGPVTPPSAPTGVSAVGGTGKATVTWNASAGATSYIVKWGTSAGTYPNTLSPASSPANVTGLTNGTLYYFVVVASNSAGSSPDSSPATATPIAIPGGINATAGDGQVSIYWSSTLGAASYKVKYGTTSGNYTTTVPVADNATTILGLTNGTTYYFVITGVNTVGESSPSPEFSARPLPPPPAAPSGLTASAVSASQINLAWTDNANNETGFLVERKTGSAGTYAQIGTAAANATAYQDTVGLSPSTQYYYRVRATNLGGNSAYSNEANATTSAIPSGVVQLSSDQDTVVGSGLVTLTVKVSQAATSAQTINLYSSNAAISVPATVTVPANSTSTTATATVTPQVNVSLVRVQLRATNASGACSTDVTVAKDSTVVVPDSPVVTSAPNKVIVRWPDFAETVAGSSYGYVVLRLNTSTQATTALNAGQPTDQTFFIDSTPTIGTSYKYAVTLVNRSTNATLATGAWSNTLVTQSTGITASWINPPTGTVSGDVTLSLSLTGGADTGTLLVDGKEVGEVSGNDLSSANLTGVIDTTGLSNGTHTVQFVMDNLGVGAVSSPITITTDNDVVNTYSGDIFEASDNRWVPTGAVVPAGATSYGVDITDENGTIIRSYSGGLDAGSPSSINVAWNLKDNSGLTVADGDYDAVINFATPSGQKQKKRHVHYVTSPPQILYLYLMEARYNATVNANISSISHNLRALASAWGLKSEFIYGIRSLDKGDRKKIRYWMVHTVTIFSANTHGSAGDSHPASVGQWPEVHYRGFSIYPADVLSPTGSGYLDDKMPERCICLPHAIDHSYHFAFMDACSSAAHDAANVSAEYYAPLPGYGNVWFSAFHMNEGDIAIGWSGYCAQNIKSNGTESMWARWRRAFWYSLCNGAYFTQAATYASNHCAPPESFAPWSNGGRLFYYGDGFATIP